MQKKKTLACTIKMIDCGYKYGLFIIKYTSFYEFYYDFPD